MGFNVLKGRVDHQFDKVDIDEGKGILEKLNLTRLKFLPSNFYMKLIQRTNENETLYSKAYCFGACLGTKLLYLAMYLLKILNY